MVAVETHGDVIHVTMASWRSRLARYSVSAYLVRGVLVDTGFPSIGGELARLLAERRPAAVMLTHHHEDHAGNLDLVARLGLPIAAAPATLAALRAGEKHVGLYRRLIWGSQRPFAEVVTPFTHDALHLLPAPGHSPDHHVVWDGDRELLFGGDLYLGTKVRVARPGEDPRELARTLRRMIALRPRVLFDGHRGLVPNAVQALTAKADWLDETIGRIDALTAAGWSRDAIRREVLGREEFTWWFTAGDLGRGVFVRLVCDGGQRRAPTNSSHASGQT